MKERPNPRFKRLSDRETICLKDGFHSESGITVRHLRDYRIMTDDSLQTPSQDALIETRLNAILTGRLKSGEPLPKHERARVKLSDASICNVCGRPMTHLKRRGYICIQCQ